MWSKFQHNHPVLYEIVEWEILALSAGAFILALAVYLGG